MTMTEGRPAPAQHGQPHRVLLWNTAQAGPSQRSIRRVLYSRYNRYSSITEHGRQGFRRCGVTAREPTAGHWDAGSIPAWPPAPAPSRWLALASMSPSPSTRPRASPRGRQPRSRYPRLSALFHCTLSRPRRYRRSWHHVCLPKLSSSSNPPSSRRAMLFRA